MVKPTSVEQAPGDAAVHAEPGAGNGSGAFAAAGARRVSGLVAPLCREITPILPSTPISQVADLILKPEYRELLCLPVVAGTRALGTISRNQLTEVFLRRYGRELFGNRPVSDIMNATPLLIDESDSLDAAAAVVSARIVSPISEDFIIVRDGHYAGIGVVIDLLAAVQARLGEAIRQIKSSQSALVHSEKMASLGQMVAGVAHEINTPLGYVRNNVELVREVFGQMRDLIADSDLLNAMLTDEAADESVLARQLAQVQQRSQELRDSGMIDELDALFGDTLYGVDAIRDLVVNLRSFTRLDASKVAEVNVNECLDQTLVIAGALLKGRVAVIKRYGDVPSVNASPSQLNQVFLNLIGNAAQATERDDGKLLLKTEAADGWLRISVQDNGRGIAPDVLSRVFEPFFTTKPAGQGTGLGLSISQQIVRAHGGDIRVSSIPGTGTRFVVFLPLRAKAASMADDA